MGCYDMFRILLILPLLPAARLLRHIAWSCCFLHHFLFAPFFSPTWSCLSRWLPRPFETCVDHVNTSMLGVTPCRALLLTLLRSATGCHSGVTFPIFFLLPRFMGSCIFCISTAAFVRDFSFIFTPSCSGWCSWGDLFAIFLAPQFFRHGRIRSGR